MLIGGAVNGSSGILTSSSTYDLQSGTGSAILAGANGLTKSTRGTVVLSGLNTYTGTTTISGGVLGVSKLSNSGAASGIGSTGTLLLNGGVLSYTGSGDATNRSITLGTAAGSGLDASGAGPVNFSNTTALGLSGGGPFTLNLSGSSADLNNIFAAQLTGNTSLTKTGAGNWTLTSATSTSTGITTISGGYLSVTTLANGGAASSLGNSTNAASNLVLDGGILRYTGSTAASSDRSFTLTANGGGFDSSGAGLVSLTSANALSFPANDTSPRTLTLSGTNTGNNLFFRLHCGCLLGSTQLVKNDPGTWALANTSATAYTYSGSTEVNNGVLKVLSGVTISGGTPINVNSGGTLQFRGRLSATF